MPAIWSSSERPLSVRTVWVDGIRHAILSPNDPLIDPKLHRRSREPRIKSCTPRRSGSESRLDRLNRCFSNLHVVVDSNPQENKSTRVYRKSSAPPCSRLSAASSASTESPVDHQRIAENREMETAGGSFEILVNRAIFKDEVCRSTLDSGGNSSRMERKQTERTFDTFWDPLFERVLQWLDLSGRAQSYEFEEDFADNSPREEDRKWRLMKRRMPTFKREPLIGKERVVIQNYKLRKDDNPEGVKTNGDTTLRRKLPKIRSARQDRNDDTSSDLLFCVSSAKASLKMEEDESKEEVRIRDRVSAAWSPSRRLQLHVMMPNIASTENTSSQESLIND